MNIKKILGAIGLLCVLSSPTFAASLINPPNTPLETSSGTTVKPNIMFILDDSGSMDWDYLGDEINDKNCKSVIAGGASYSAWSNWSFVSSYSRSYRCSNNKPNNTLTEQYQCVKINRNRFDLQIKTRTQTSVAYTQNNFGRSCASNGIGSNLTRVYNLNNYNSSNNTSIFAPDVQYFAYQFNKIYYNPSVKYKVGVNYLGASLGDQSISAAKINIFSGSNATADLLNNLKETYFCNKSNPSEIEKQNKSICVRNGIDTPNPFNYIAEAYPNESFNYPVSGPSVPHYYNMIATEFCDENGVICSSTSTLSNIPFPIRWCASANDAVSTSVISGQLSGVNKCQAKYVPGKFTKPRYGNFNRITVDSHDYTNYANWYTYYKDRISAMKTSAGLAFKSIDSNKRVGIATLNSGSFLNVKDFDSTQKQSFYNTLYATNPRGGTRLKGALANIGRYYANKLGRTDPVQYSCQQNYSLLATDGYWNFGDVGKDIAGNNITNEDNTNLAGNYTLRSDGVYDGSLSSSSGTLADVAMYYYKTDIRNSGFSNCTSGATGDNVCINNVPVSTSDTNPNQHMVTYAISLGINGFMSYTKDYYKGTNKDLENIKKGVSGACSWTTGVCDWPVPVGGSPTAIDDLWHATVNGRGRYFSAENSDEIISGLSDALSSLVAQTSSSAAAATSSPNITSTDNSLFYTTYRTVSWDGEITANTIDSTTGVVETVPIWSARTMLNSKVSASSDTRNIYYMPKGGNVLKNFDLATIVSTDGLLSTNDASGFKNKCSGISQCSSGSLSLVQKTQVDTGVDLVNYLRGQSQYEIQNTANPFFRNKEFVLGDIVDAAPIYVAESTFSWTDTGYDTYKATTIPSSRTPMVYASANDGMIHGFNALTGAEQWAIIPRSMMQKMYLLSDQNYNYNHQFFMDGQLAVMDAKLSSGWKTVVVAGMGPGGKGYVALDVTDPSAPKALWEFCKDSTVCSKSDAELGYSYGNPMITKRALDGKWVVYLTSGYDNSTGAGIVYELDLETGATLRKLYTGSGTGGTVSATNQVGLAKINSYYDDFSKDNTTKYIYAGDLNGDIWKWDLTGGSPTVVLLGTTKGPSVAQPITTKVDLAKINTDIILFVSTGSYFNGSDVANTDIQSVYALKDTNANLGILRDNVGMVSQTITPGTITSSASSNFVDLSQINTKGWYFDLNSQVGERVNVDSILAVGTLSVISNVPASSLCTAGGNAWYYQVDYLSGGALPTNGGIIAKKLYGGLVVGQVIVKLGESGIMKNLITDASGKLTPVAMDANANAITVGSNKFRKSSWREIYKK